MSKDHKAESVGVQLKGKGNYVGRNVIIGSNTAIDVEGEANEVSENLAIAPPLQPPKNPPKPSFWHHPLTKTVLYVVGVVVAAALIWFFGLK
ncbi:MAG TPA: hypothetical protein VJT81_13500 [Burkholderiales bacterium]|nr:hypothetical protein [Burkholderiales bacterium]